MNGAKMIVGRAFFERDRGWCVHVKNNPDPAPWRAEAVVKGRNGWSYFRPANRAEIEQRLTDDAYSVARLAQFRAEVEAARGASA